jgi:hypothetical protein
MDLSPVTIEQSVCPICGKAEDSGNIVLDMKLRDVFEMRTPGQWNLCAAHQKLSDDGFIALVEADPKSPKLANGNTDPACAYRTGTVVHILRDVAVALFGLALDPRWPMVFVEPHITKRLHELVAENMRAKQRARLEQRTKL